MKVSIGPKFVRLSKYGVLLGAVTGELPSRVQTTCDLVLRGLSLDCVTKAAISYTLLKPSLKLLKHAGLNLPLGAVSPQTPGAEVKAGDVRRPTRASLLKC